MKKLQYRLYCETEQDYIMTTWLDDTDPVPTQCPNDIAHTIDTDRTTILDEREE